MVIQVDQEGMAALSQLCDIALKSAGLKNLDQINVILGSTVQINNFPKHLSPQNAQQITENLKQNPDEKVEEKNQLKSQDILKGGLKRKKNRRL